MNSNNILFISSEFPPQPGGIGNHAFNLSDSLQNEGQNITVLTDVRSQNGELENKFDSQLKYKVKRVKRRRIILLSYFDRFFKAIKLTSKNDTVLASGKFSLWLVFFLHLFYKKKYIAIVHGSELLLPKKFLQNFTYRCLRSCNQIIAVSNYTKNIIRDLNFKNIHVIPNGFSIAKFKNVKHYNHLNEQLVLITVGNVSQRKGQHNVVQAIPVLLKTFPNLIYRIVGIPSDKDKIEKLAKELNVENHIEFYGKVSEEKKRELLVSSTIFMMLSEETAQGAVEGFGIAIIEANALGVPAIGSKDCGIEDAISNKLTGVLVGPTNVKSILNAVTDIISSYSDYSKNAVHWSDNFHWNKIVLHYLEILEK